MTTPSPFTILANITVPTAAYDALVGIIEYASIEVSNAAKFASLEGSADTSLGQIHDSVIAHTHFFIGKAIVGNFLISVPTSADERDETGARGKEVISPELKSFHDKINEAVLRSLKKVLSRDPDEIEVKQAKDSLVKILRAKIEPMVKSKWQEHSNRSHPLDSEGRMQPSGSYGENKTYAAFFNGNETTPRSEIPAFGR